MLDLILDFKSFRMVREIVLLFVSHAICVCFGIAFLAEETPWSIAIIDEARPICDGS